MTTFIETRAGRRGDLPLDDGWWGYEQCEFCLQAYVYEQEHRCVDCDCAVCLFCLVVRVDDHASRCPGCATPASNGQE